MFGEGMPWDIILLCMFAGLFLGMISAKKDKKRRDEEA